MEPCPPMALVGSRNPQTLTSHSSAITPIGLECTAQHISVCNSLLSVENVCSVKARSITHYHEEPTTRPTDRTAPIKQLRNGWLQHVCLITVSSSKLYLGRCTFGRADILHSLALPNYTNVTTPLTGRRALSVCVCVCLCSAVSLGSLSIWFYSNWLC